MRIAGLSEDYDLNCGNEFDERNPSFRVQCLLKEIARLREVIAFYELNFLSAPAGENDDCEPTEDSGDGAAPEVCAEEQQQPPGLLE